MAWQNFHGAYDNTGPYANVVLGGNPGYTADFGFPLATAHAKGYGKGINFSDDGNYGVTFTLDLVGYVVTDAGQYTGNGKYVQYGGRYNYILIISVSNNNKASWREIYNQVIFSHADTWSLAYSSGWETVAQNSQWSGKLQLPTDTTHVKVELRGEDATFPYENIYSIQQVIPDFRPWAVRKGGIFYSLDRDTGWFKKRVKDSWVTIGKYSADKANKENQGSSRIRKNGKWVGQGKIGS